MLSVDSVHEVPVGASNHPVQSKCWDESKHSTIGWIFSINQYI